MPRLLRGRDRLISGMSTLRGHHAKELSAEFRRKVLGLVEAGRPVAEIAGGRCAYGASPPMGGLFNSHASITTRCFQCSPP